ncbi:unnamed protein product, partial [Discosporangium mesarthrocarpum]
GTVSLSRKNPSARSNCLELLRFCLSDLSPPRLMGMTRGDAAGLRSSLRRDGAGARGGEAPLVPSYEELAGLPLAPLADGSHGTLKRLVTVDPANLAELQAMGFTEGRCRRALLRHPELSV